ncbi:MAG: hypothetical protein Q4Q53_03640 [Methanocorpusculum sp.]|nr:hypothetical protein [Methanocorpusculum sp.]
MKTTERLIGLTILSIVFILAGALGIFLTPEFLLSTILIITGIAALVWTVIRRIRYSKHPELKEKDNCPAKDERDMMINLKATNVVYMTLIVTLLISNLYGEYLAKFLDGSLGDTLSIIRAICLALIILIAAAYFISYAIFQKMN